MRLIIECRHTVLCPQSTLQDDSNHSLRPLMLLKHRTRNASILFLKLFGCIHSNWVVRSMWVSVSNANLSVLQELGAAGLTKRPTSCMLILPKPLKGGEEDAEFDEAYEDVLKRVKAVQPVF